MLRAVRGLVLLATLAAACGDDASGYRVLVRIADDALAERTDRIEVALIGGCDEIPLGAPPPPDARRLEVVRGETPAAFGEVEPGTRGLYARAFDEDECAVIAAGCATVELEEGGSGTLVVDVGTIEARTCPRGTQCVAGSCTPVGIDPVDAGPMPLEDAATRDAATRDTGTAEDAGPPPAGDGWVDVPCDTSGSFCGDSLARVYGRCYPTSSGLRCCAGCYDVSTQRCEPGTTDEHCGWAGDPCDECSATRECMDFDPIWQCQ